MKYVRCAAVTGAAMLFLAVGCSSASDTGSSTAATSSAAEESSVADPQPAGTVIDVTIMGGDISPTNERLDAVVGEPITLRVNSDTTDELHIHSVPDHTFEVEAKADQTFEFTVDVPGSVAIELHHADRTVATLAVRP
ncbi:hypothetical protein CH253_00925 [Rhodococcus sp. 06-156-3C]|uniref:hypothetical protein n=1 Tax=Nocardiaceae TaxID=85025 RepID=UPI000522EBC4|nr:MULTISPECIES: hypothetical protein [Rhodococcus]OZD05367.1 hypothetical protein CH280_26435 [Rhodococcus sp. 06-156-4C]OZD16476.1 hypothetical protein CH248_19405 [Rhodococcus sp. 06-156-4a]OZD26335.1 hypothetical protein CH253_00925 [Rhodococcus sp. 06-156-3C]OZD31730.1 hypothetical protein CH247_11235 [Rhodococcus sp. 06-156-3b]OZD35029.1 hypothetical protein CH284_13975 [Rhodococcus sp. 06-156-3]